MGVISECQAGDTLVCIQSFFSSPAGQRFSWDTSKQFRVGQRFRFLGHQRSENLKNHAEGWLVLFEGSDHRKYVASQTFFVTEDAWQDVLAAAKTDLIRDFAKRYRPKSDSLSRPSSGTQSVPRPSGKKKVRKTAKK